MHLHSLGGAAAGILRAYRASGKAVFLEPREAMKEKEETSHRTQGGKHHQNAGKRYGKWQRGTQAVASGHGASCTPTSPSSIAGRREVGQQKSENRAYVSNVTCGEEGGAG